MIVNISRILIPVSVFSQVNPVICVHLAQYCMITSSHLTTLKILNQKHNFALLHFIFEDKEFTFLTWKHGLIISFLKISVISTVRLPFIG